MRIQRIEATAHSHPFDAVALSFGVGRNVKRDMVLVKIVAEDGTTGYGEAHHALAPTAIAEIVNYSIAPLICGMDCLDREGIFDRIYRSQVQTHGTGTAAVIAASGVDIALLDLAGKILKQPVYALLGGTRKRIPAYAGGLSLGFQPLPSLEREVQAIVDRGYKAIKLRVGQDPRIDSERVGLVRRQFGDHLKIAVDAATRYAMVDAREIARYCEKYEVWWIEEPFTPDNLDGYRLLKRYTATPVAAGENHFTKQAFRELLRLGAVDIVQADCTKAGGITEVKKIADMAAAYHVRVAPHTSQSALSSAANLHLLSAIPNALVHEVDLAPVNPFRDNLARNPPELVDGGMMAPAGDGLGLEIDEQVLKGLPAVPGPCYLPP
ncbi:MAG: mandelate racemase/muconate lactonizing enzyme family protein [Alphaproteobacteria bacterium]|nr:mandelate racemase/muconate lactonizing enzyme family protein [Alphaproteobacteria bacterium]